MSQDKKNKNKNGVPDRWLNYRPMGRRIPGTRFIAFKVPLKPSLNCRVPESDSFGLWDLLDSLESQNQELGLIIDLTFTTKYYNLTDVPQSCSYIKILTKGHHVPSDATILRFKRAVRCFLKENQDNNKLIGVHCTHGLNRTGYLVCRYLIDVDGLDPLAALELFNSCRGHHIERKNYLHDLKRSAKRSNKGIDESEEVAAAGLAVERPPASTARGPPAERPPASTARGPPAERPPASTARGPPAERPPASTARGPPAERPQASTARGLPAERPPASTARGLPAERPPASTARGPPAESLPASTARGPPAERPPASTARGLPAERPPASTARGPPAESLPASTARGPPAECPQAATKGTQPSSDDPADGKRQPGHRRRRRARHCRGTGQKACEGPPQGDDLPTPAKPTPGGERQTGEETDGQVKREIDR